MRPALQSRRAWRSRLLAAPGVQHALDVTADGTVLVFEELTSRSERSLWTLSLADRTPTALVKTEFDELNGRLSPDDRWLAYSSTESGRAEVYVAAFPGMSPLRIVSIDGGREPRWAPSGDSLYFVDAEGCLSVCDVRAAPGTSGPVVGRPKRLFVG